MIECDTISPDFVYSNFGERSSKVITYISFSETCSPA